MYIFDVTRGFAKRTLMKTARKAGLKPKESRKQKYILPTPPLSRRGPRLGDPTKDRPSSLSLDDELAGESANGIRIRIRNILFDHNTCTVYHENY